MKAILEQDFTANVKIFFEHSLEINGCTYLVIFGRHINGGFIAIPNWNICCEASRYEDDTNHNYIHLVEAGLEKNVAKAIAKYINDVLTSAEKESEEN